MARLRQRYEEFAQRDTVIIAIGPEDAGSFTSWWHREKMPFTGIADPKHRIADIFGQQVKMLKWGRMSASILIDKKGDIRYRHYGEDMSDIPEEDRILHLIDELNREK